MAYAASNAIKLTRRCDRGQKFHHTHVSSNKSMTRGDQLRDYPSGSAIKFGIGSHDRGQKIHHTHISSNERMTCGPRCVIKRQRNQVWNRVAGVKEKNSSCKRFL